MLAFPSFFKRITTLFMAICATGAALEMIITSLVVMATGHPVNVELGNKVEPGKDRLDSDNIPVTD